MQSNSKALVSVVDGTLVAGGRTLLDKINLSVGQGEIVTVIGPNGAGKSTLVKALLGLRRLTSGRVEMADGVRVGYVPQQFFHSDAVPMTVQRLLSLTLRPTSEELDEALSETGIAHLREARVDSLSGGELQRALLARALLRKPQLLVLDEPVQAVDFLGEVKIYELIARIRQRTGCGILMVSHDLHVVMAESDRVICLNGHICCEGVPERVQADPEFTRLFGPAAARIIAAYTHHHDHDHDVCKPDDHDHGHDHHHHHHAATHNH